jgi:hypothetical protein
MATGNLNKAGLEIGGFDSIIIVKDLTDIPAGVTLDVAGESRDTIPGGSVLIHNTVTGAVKPLGITGSNNDTYASLDTNEEYYGILKYSVLKSEPFAAVLRAGTVNAGAAAKAVGAAITDTIKAGLPRIDFIY